MRARRLYKGFRKHSRCMDEIDEEDWADKVIGDVNECPGGPDERATSATTDQGAAAAAHAP